MLVEKDVILAELLKRDFFEFLREFWDETVTEPLIANWHIPFLCAELHEPVRKVVERRPKHKDIIINIPPGTTKSTIITQYLNAWVWTKDPSIRFLSSSYAKDLSTEHSVITRRIVMSEKYKRLFPHVRMAPDQAGKTNFKTTAGGQRFTTSTGSTATGMHSHIIVVDDPQNPGMANSDIKREEANDFTGKTLVTRKVNKAVTLTIIVMQRLHEKDVTGYLLDKKPENYTHYCLPGDNTTEIKPAYLEQFYKYDPFSAAENPVKLLDIQRMNEEVLDDMRVSLGSYGYSGQFGQNPAPSSGGIFEKEWFEIVEPGEQTMVGVKHQVIDPAYTSKEENDPSGTITYTLVNGTYFIQNWHKVSLEFPELCKDIVRHAKAMDMSRRSIITVEPKASGKSVVQTLRKHTKLSIKEGKNPTIDKVARARDVSPLCETGRVKLVKGHWNEDFLMEVVGFPKREHDEAVDCLEMMLNGKSKRKGIKRRN